MRLPFPSPVALFVFAGLAGAHCIPAAAAEELPTFDFTQPAVAAEWTATHDVASMAAGEDGLAIAIDGGDPHVTGPSRDYPAEIPLRMTLVIQPPADGMLQVFHFPDHASERRSVAMPVRGGEWNEVRAMLPPLGPRVRLRIDPPGSSGTAVIRRIDFEPAASLAAPAWPPHERFDTVGGRRLQAGSLAVVVTPRGYVLEVDGTRVAASHARPLAGYVMGGRVRWLEIDTPADVRVVEGRAGGEGRDGAPAALEAAQSVRDDDGGMWRIVRRFSAGRENGQIDLEIELQVDRDRAIAFLPLVLLVAHEGTIHKQQAVFPGLEYLADEPSSSEADLVGPQSRRQVPANHKITFPLMAVANQDRVVALAWHHSPRFAALFDSPDRLLGSGGHLLGVIAPGSDGFNRHEGDPLPIAPGMVAAGEKIVLQATLIGCVGNTVVPALAAFGGSRGFPAMPSSGDFTDYAALATAGWLDSGVRFGGRFRHAIGTSFPPQPAADAAVYLTWLAGQSTDVATRLRLTEAAGAALEAVPTGSFDEAAVGHVRLPVQSLVFGRIEETVATHAATARRLLASVRPDGTVAYSPAADGIDYGRTHDTDHANGLSARCVADALEAARFAGDSALIAEAMVALRRLLFTYAGSVPRGGQAWEIPLHTPDLLASAHLVRACTIGHELTGEKDLFDAAVAWAWTGLPFVYLVDPVGTADGPYGCVTVFGATSWTSPVWIGRPVQWCGLVYAHALYRLAKHDPSGPWRRVADGITATAVRYSWPRAKPGDAAAAFERQGLLPDGWEVQQELRVDPPINPGSLQACAVELFGRGPMLDCRVLPYGARRVIVHAPGAIEPVVTDGPGSSGENAEAAERLDFRVSGWPRQPYAVLVTGLPAAPDVTVDGQEVEITAPNHFDPTTGRLVVWIDASRAITLRAAVGSPTIPPRGRSQ